MEYFAVHVSFSLSIKVLLVDKLLANLCQYLLQTGLYSHKR